MLEVADFLYLCRLKRILTMKMKTKTCHPCAKINLGLNIVSRRADGYHLLESVFYPIPLCDTLTVSEGDGAAGTCTLHLSGMELEGNPEDNLVVKAYRLLAADFPLPHVEIDLHKAIPSQAGLGGGSSDAAAMLNVINELFAMGLDADTLRGYAVRLGADCAFFIDSVAAYATGIGEVLTPMEQDVALQGKYIVLVKPPVAVSTREAYSHITPRQPRHHCVDTVCQPVTTWRGRLTNDFEDSVFPAFPEIAAIKERLYDLGAVFALMSGSGCSVFGIFDEEPQMKDDVFEGCKVFKGELKGS